MTAVLVILTAYYARLNRRMVAEMRAAREAIVLPHNLVVSVHIFGPGYGTIRVTNVGPGAAIDVDVELRMEPGNEWRVRWTQPVVTAGEAQDFYPHNPPGSETSPMMRLDETHRAVRHAGHRWDLPGCARPVAPSG